MKRIVFKFEKKGDFKSFEEFIDNIIADDVDIEKKFKKNGNIDVLVHELPDQDEDDEW